MNSNDLDLVGQLEEMSSRNNIRLTWEEVDQSMSYAPQNAQTQGFFQPLDCNPTLQIGSVHPFWLSK